MNRKELNTFIEWYRGLPELKADGIKFSFREGSDTLYINDTCTGIHLDFFGGNVHLFVTNVWISFALGRHAFNRQVLIFLNERYDDEDNSISLEEAKEWVITSIEYILEANQKNINELERDGESLSRAIDLIKTVK